MMVYIKPLFIILNLVIWFSLAAISGVSAQEASEWQRYPDAEFNQSAPPSIEWNKYIDEETGYEVWQISSNDAGTWAAHYESQAFTPDDRFLIFSSELAGNWQLYRADLSSGEVIQLTDLDDSVCSSCYSVHPDGEEAYFSFGGTLGRVNIYTGEIYGMKYDVPVRFHRTFSNSEDGVYTVLSSSGDGQSTFFLISLPDGKIEASLPWPIGSTISYGLQWDGSASHPMINPVYPHLVTFRLNSTFRLESGIGDRQNNMSFPLPMRVRTWIWDARTGEIRPFLPVPYHYRGVHMSWGGSGEHYYYFRKAQPGWTPNSIASMNLDGKDWQIHHHDHSLRLGHGATSKDEKWFISDGQDHGRNPLRLINLETGKWEDLTWPNASISPGHSEQAHVHPSFSSSGNFVTYTSDRTGSPEAYVVPIPEELKERLSHHDHDPRKPRTDASVPEPVVTGYGEGLFQIGELLYWDDFENLNDWVFQIQETDDVSEPRIDTRDGFLDVLMPNRGATIWNRHKFSGPITIIYNVIAPTTFDHIDGIVPRDINSFWHASDPVVPWDVLDERYYTGAFPSYHKQKGYYASTGGRDNTTTRFRHYPRMAEGEDVEHIALNDRDGLEGYLIDPGTSHTIQLVAYNDVIQYIVDGKVFYEIREGDTVTILTENGEETEAVYTRDRFPVYSEGWFGFRMVSTHHIFSHVRVYQLQQAD